MIEEGLPEVAMKERRETRGEPAAGAGPLKQHYARTRREAELGVGSVAMCAWSEANADNRDEQPCSEPHEVAEELSARDAVIKVQHVRGPQQE